MNPVTGSVNAMSMVNALFAGGWTAVVITGFGPPVGSVVSASADHGPCPAVPVARTCARYLPPSSMPYDARIRACSASSSKVLVCHRSLMPVPRKRSVYPITAICSASCGSSHAAMRSPPSDRRVRFSGALGVGCSGASGTVIGPADAHALLAAPLAARTRPW